MSGTQQLKRSQKTDFGNAPAPPVLMRERSFIRQPRDAQKRRSQTMISMRTGKPTMELYRPPNVRTDLNVHAKEFTMQPEQVQLQLQHSKSSGNILRHHQIVPVPIQLVHSASSSQLLAHLPRPGLQYHPVLPTYWAQLQQQQQQAQLQQQQQQQQQLKRSKSLNSADYYHQNLPNKLKEDMDLSIFAKEDQDSLKQALEDPNQLQTRTLMDLVKTIMDKVADGIRFSEPLSKLCVQIIENENNQTFLETLLNTCQQWYQERDKILRNIKAGDGTRFTAYMWFLTEMCGQLKRHQLHEQFELQPELVLLSVLAKCCQACVSLPIVCLAECECLFFVLTSIGRDLEAELPLQLEQLLAAVRDAFLGSVGASKVRRTLLQLIELHASNWQLPGSSVLYYYPRIK